MFCVCKTRNLKEKLILHRGQHKRERLTVFIKILRKFKEFFYYLLRFYKSTFNYLMHYCQVLKNCFGKNSQFLRELNKVVKILPF